VVEDKRVVVFDCVLNLGLAAAGANAEAAVAVSKRVSSFMIVAVVMALLCYLLLSMHRIGAINFLRGSSAFSFSGKKLAPTS